LIVATQSIFDTTILDQSQLNCTYKYHVQTLECISVQVIN